MKSPKVDAAIEVVRSGKVSSFREAAEFTGCTPEAVRNRWNKSEETKPPFKARDLPTVDEDHEPTPTERELARKAITIGRQRDVARSEAQVHAQRSTELEDEVEKLKKLVGVKESAEAQNPPEWMIDIEDRGDHRGTLVAPFSDFHVGEVVEPAEVAYYNAYNPDIAEQRIKRYFERAIRMARQYLNGVKYDGIVVPSLGDTVSGDIHDEFRETNEWTNYQATSRVVPWLEEGLGMFAEEFGRVHYVQVPGNHPRDSKKPRYKKRSAHNADQFIGWQLEQRLGNDDRFTFDVSEGISADFQIYNTRFRCEHGDEAKGGSGIQGAMLPIALMTHRRRKQAEAEGHPFDCMLIGHWHQYMSMVGKGFLVNGAGKGYDEYARGKGFEPEPPQQALLVVTPEHGIGVQAPLFVGKRSEEGW